MLDHTLVNHTASHTWPQAVPSLFNLKIFNVFWFTARCKKERAKQTFFRSYSKLFSLSLQIQHHILKFLVWVECGCLSYFEREPQGDKSDLNSGHGGMNITVHKWDLRPTAELLVEPSESHFHIDISNQVRSLWAEGTAA